MTDLPRMSTAADLGRELWLPAALRPRGEDEARADRAARLVAQLGVHTRSPLVEPRFVEGARGLALALTGLAVMSANHFAAQLADELAARLEAVLVSAEEALAGALPAIQEADAARRRARRRSPRATMPEPARARP